MHISRAKYILDVLIDNYIDEYGLYPTIRYLLKIGLTRFELVEELSLDENDVDFVLEGLDRR